MTLRIGSLFSGYGGLEIGIAQVLDAVPAWHSEIEPGPMRVLEHHWPGVPNLGDVTAVDWCSVEPVEILCGGFPCQDVSLAGLRRGLKPGTRSGLWSHFAAAIDGLRPGLVVIENVRGLLSAEAHSDLEPDSWDLGGPARPDRPALRALGAVLGDLADLGYDAEWFGLRAADAGAPHGRFRVFVLARPAADPGGEARRLRAGLRPGGDDLTTTVFRALLPTPTTTQQGTDALAAERPEAGPNLHNAVAALLPTSSATMANDAEDPDDWWERWEYHANRTDQRPTQAGMPLAISAKLLARGDHSRLRFAAGRGSSDG